MDNESKVSRTVRLSLEEDRIYSQAAEELGWSWSKTAQYLMKMGNELMAEKEGSVKRFYLLESLSE